MTNIEDDETFAKAANKATSATEVPVDNGDPPVETHAEAPPVQDRVKAQLSVQREHILFVGDSVLHNANFRVIEKATGANVKTAKAYAADYDLKSRFPNKNIVYVARNEAKRKPFKYVFIQSPSVHITNLDTKVNSNEDINMFKHVVEQSAAKVVAVTERVLAENPTVEKVIIADCIPRVDQKNDDPHGLKPELAVYSNTVMKNLVSSSDSKAKIMIGNHSISCNADTYGLMDGPTFDAIHGNLKIY